MGLQAKLGNSAMKKYDNARSAGRVGHDKGWSAGQVGYVSTIKDGLQANTGGLETRPGLRGRRLMTRRGQPRYCVHVTCPTGHVGLDLSAVRRVG